LTSRRRAATLILVLGLGAIVLDLWRRAPRDVRVRYRWGEARHALKAATVAYEREGDPVREATFRYARGAPYEQKHPVRLARGKYVVRVRLHYDAGPRRVSKRFQLQDQDEITLDGPW